MNMDIWDPNTWEVLSLSCRLYLDDKLTNYVSIDVEDFSWASCWRWHINKPHKARTGSKLYAVRSTGRGGEYSPKLYLHVEIMKRTGILPPGPEFKLVDHRDGNEFNCCRGNLRWATHVMNSQNRNCGRLKV